MGKVTETATKRWVREQVARINQNIGVVATRTSNVAASMVDFKTQFNMLMDEQGARIESEIAALRERVGKVESVPTLNQAVPEAPWTGDKFVSDKVPGWTGPTVTTKPYATAPLKPIRLADANRKAIAAVEADLTRTVRKFEAMTGLIVTSIQNQHVDGEEKIRVSVGNDFV